MKKSKLNKKPLKKASYIPMYVAGGPVVESPEDALGGINSGSSNRGFGNALENAKTGFNNNYKSIGSSAAGVHLSGVNNASNAGIETYGEDSYNQVMAGVSKAGPIGAAIGGISAIGDAIGKPIRAKTEAIDPETGAYKDSGKAERMRTVGSFLNPLKSGLDAMGDPNATGWEKVGAFLGGPGAQRSISRRREKERMEAIAKQNAEIQRNTAVGTRLAEESIAEPMQFAGGGYLEETSNNPDITYFANGGTHEENPNGGIPLGNKGLVEEGEFKYKDYIFSNRF